MADENGKRYDVYQFWSQSTPWPSVYFAIPVGTRVGPWRLNHDRAGMRILMLYDDRLEPHEELCCTICVQDAQEGERLRATDCNHKFHTNCIIMAMQYRTLCPNCNNEISIPWLA